MMGTTDGAPLGTQVSILIALFFSALVAAIPAPSGATPSSSATGNPVPSTGTSSCPGGDGGYFTGPNGFHYRLKCSTDRLGGDLYALTGQPDIRSCVQLCDADKDCVGSTWKFSNGRTNGGICYLKSSLAPETSDATVDVVMCEDCPQISCPRSDGMVAWSNGKAFQLLCNKEQQCKLR